MEEVAACLRMLPYICVHLSAYVDSAALARGWETQQNGFRDRSKGGNPFI